MLDNLLKGLLVLQLLPHLYHLLIAENVISLSHFYRCYFGRCSSELAKLITLPYFCGRSTHYCDRLHDLSVSIPRKFMSVVCFHALLGSGILCLESVSL